MSHESEALMQAELRRGAFIPGDTPTYVQLRRARARPQMNFIYPIKKTATWKYRLLMRLLSAFDAANFARTRVC